MCKKYRKSRKKLKVKKKESVKVLKKNPERFSKKESVKTFIHQLVENAKKSGKNALVFAPGGKQMIN